MGGVVSAATPPPPTMVRGRRPTGLGAQAEIGRGLQIKSIHMLMLTRMALHLEGLTPPRVLTSKIKALVQNGAGSPHS